MFHPNPPCLFCLYGKFAVTLRAISAQVMFKKLDIFVFKAFAQLFCGTFFISLFVFMMQFLWKWMDELIGKGLSFGHIAHFLYYAALTLVPTALPLGVLLASLVTFGNLGEKFELLSMKAAGIPLRRILLPIFLFDMLVCGGSFYFQNVVSPEAVKQLAAFTWTMRQKSPELEIPEGVFYNNIPGYNLYVGRKDKERGILYDVMIYSTTNGYEDAQIVLADSGRLQSTADQMHLKFTLWVGERFQNMQNQGGMSQRANVPYMRETFLEEVDYIKFDAGFNLMDANAFNANAQTKGIDNLSHSIDSINGLVDSVGRSVMSMQMSASLNRKMRLQTKDSLRALDMAKTLAPFDTLYANVKGGERRSVARGAQSKVKVAQSEYEFRSLMAEDNAFQLRRHWMEIHRKFTLSLACAIFFFIGAPLGAIIRKGGLGLPVVTSVIIFIFYYIVTAAGEKLAKTGNWDTTFGVWFSSMVFLPIAVWLTYKANGDSNLFNWDAYRLTFERLAIRLKLKKQQTSDNG